jgi:glycosyltransferase involved in cell wall biosynthesis
MENKIKRVYLMPEIWATVTQSQVFGWLETQKSIGFSADLISFSSNTQKDINRKDIEERIDGEFFQYKSKPMFVQDVFVLLVLLKYYRNHSKNNDKIIFHTRIQTIGFILSIINLLPKARVILDARAAVIEEMLFVNANNNSFKYKLKLLRSKHSEKLLIKKANKVVCVSEALKNYYINKYNLKSPDKFIVIPGAADENDFQINPNLRSLMRDKLGLPQNSNVVIYSGRLEMKWEVPEHIFEVFGELKTKNPNLKLIILTPDMDLAKEISSNYEKIANDIVIANASYKEVNAYLNAADWGLLLREDIPMNNVASPTKYAEYLLTGLNIIISKGVHDFAAFTKKFELGLIVEELKLNEVELHNYKNNPTKVRELGKDYFSKKAFHSVYKEVFETI